MAADPPHRHPTGLPFRFTFLCPRAPLPGASDSRHPDHAPPPRHTGCSQALLARDPTWGPGPADLLREVAGTLADLASSHTRWPTGIECIGMDHRIDLPSPIWRWMLQHLGDLGVEVHELPEPAPVEQLTILTADTVWDAAPVAARVLSQWHRDATPHTVLATLPSDQLDRELRRRNLRPWAWPSSARNALSPVIRVFLEAVSAPHDISALADLLTTTLTVSDLDRPDRPGDSTPQPPVRLLPLPVCSALLDALAGGLASGARRGRPP